MALTSAYTTPTRRIGNASSSRKAFLQTCTKSTIAIASTTFLTTTTAQAFDGRGSSAYIGKSPTSKAEIKKSYQTRIIANVKDFKKLGATIQTSQSEGDAWVNFFIEYKRREPDEYGRTYAALIDLVGNKELSGCGILLASSFAKPGKPSEGLPQVNKYNAGAKMFDPIRVAGMKGDVEKAKVAWGKAAGALGEYLGVMDLPSSLYDPFYE